MGLNKQIIKKTGEKNMRTLITSALILTAGASYASESRYIEDKPDTRPAIPSFGRAYLDACDAPFMQATQTLYAYAGEAYDDQRRAVEDEAYREEQIRELEEDYPEKNVRERYERDEVSGPISVPVN